MIFRRIDHVEIVTDRPDETVAFYTDVLGFTVRERGYPALSGLAASTGGGAATSSVHTEKLLSVFGPKVVVIATSAASRPRAISTRPMRGMLLRASKMYH